MSDIRVNSQPAALTKEQIEDLRDYLMDIECPFDESIVDALCDLALKGLSGGPEGVVAMPEAIRGEWTPRRCLRLGQAADYLENVVSSFGPDEGLELTQESWARMREKIIVLIAAVR